MKSNETVLLVDYIRNFAKEFPGHSSDLPWQVVPAILSLVEKKIGTLSSGYRINGNVAIHETARIEEHAVLKGPLIISANCFVAAHVYLRGGVFLGESVSLGPGCEVKSSLIFNSAALAHFNFVGDSLVGSGTNMEAGSVVANCFNERSDKEVSVFVGGLAIKTGCAKFGALIGDGTRIGANAVLSPGTVLEPGAVVKRLELVEQH